MQTQAVIRHIADWLKNYAAAALDGFSLNGLSVKEASAKTKAFVTEHQLGRVKTNYSLRDAIFSVTLAFSQQELANLMSA